jgi:hypothetical protein
MSDRTPSSVRTGVRTGDTAGDPAGNTATPTESAAPGQSAPVSATQSIPTTGSQRAQGATDGATPASAAPAQPVGGPPGAPPVPPPATGTSTGRTVTGGAAADVTTPARGRGRGAAKTRGPRRARLQLRHIDTWSALKISLVLSIALFFIWMVAVAVLYGVLSALGVFDTLNDLFGQLGSSSGSGGGGDVITPGLVFWGAAVIGAINVVLMTALCTVGTFIYNLCSDLVGGLELTLSERD